MRTTPKPHSPTTPKPAQVGEGKITARVAGDLAGRGRIDDDFDAPMSDEALWDQAPIEPTDP